MSHTHPEHGMEGESFSFDCSDLERQLIGFTAEEREALMELLKMFGEDAA
jgi:hypothetical protein